MRRVQQNWAQSITNEMVVRHVNSGRITDYDTYTADSIPAKIIVCRIVCEENIMGVSNADTPVNSITDCVILNSEIARYIDEHPIVITPVDPAMRNFSLNITENNTMRPVFKGHIPDGDIRQFTIVRRTIKRKMLRIYSIWHRRTIFDDSLDGIPHAVEYDIGWWNTNTVPCGTVENVIL